MLTEDLISATAQHVKNAMLGESSGHDWWHVYRVWQLAIRIGREEGADLTVVQLGALLHDIADWKAHDGDTEIGPKVAREWLERCEVDPRVIDHVAELIGTGSFRGAGVADVHRTKEAQVVQDADRLDAIGAIGIARTFAYGGANGRAMYDPGVPPQFHDSADRYLRSPSPTINHFHEKLLLLKDRMNTDCGRRIAEGRHRYMEEYLVRFGQEWNGEA